LRDPLFAISIGSLKNSRRAAKIARRHIGADSKFYIQSRKGTIRDCASRAIFSQLRIKIGLKAINSTPFEVMTYGATALILTLSPPGEYHPPLFASCRNPMVARFRRMPWLLCILLGALAARAGAAIGVQHWVDQTPGRLCLIEGDAAGYWDLARHLSRGEDFAIYDPPRYVERMPGFPAVLAGGMKLLGERPLPLRLLLAIVGTAACGLVYLLGRELVDHSAGLVGCLLAAISPSLVVFSVLFLSETLFAGALLASLIALARLVKADLPADSTDTRGRRIGLAVVAGFLAALATLVRPTWLLVAPGFAMAWLAAPGNRKERFAPALAMLCALAVTMAPWTIRNYRVTGHFVPTTLWVGASLYDGISPQATGDSDMRFVEKDGHYTRRDVRDFEYQADRHYRQTALEFAREHPGRVLVLAAIKLSRFFNPFPNAAQFGHWMIAWGVGLFESLVLLVAIAGGWRLRAAAWQWLLAAGPLLYFALVHSVFVGSVRYRLPAEYPLLVLSAVGLVAITRWRAGRRPIG
jgi:4-amino-4-deoxy-L-arabinose transferase-like glycosyltransferase